ncbi:hypothetical protein PENTCL1PPCAC_26151, partial [Pristionchus entomophagus]
EDEIRWKSRAVSVDTRLVLEDTPGEDAASSFKCCNGIVHVKTSALFAGISALILSLFSTVCLILGVYTVNWWLDVILIIINTIVSIVMIWGLYLDSPPMIIPFIVTEIAQCAGFFMLACYVCWFTISFNQDKFRKFDQVIMVISILIGIFIAGSAVWAAAKAYHYIVRKRARLILGSSSFSLHTISTSLSSSTLPSSDYPWAHGHSFPYSPYRPPTPPRFPPKDLVIPNGSIPYHNETTKYPHGSNGTAKYQPGSNGTVNYHNETNRNLRHSPKPIYVHPIRSTTVTSNRSGTVYRSPSPTVTPSRCNGFPPIPSLMTSSTPSFPSRKRVSFSAEPDHSLSMTRSLYDPSSSSRNYFLNDYTRPILSSHPSSPPSSLFSSRSSSIARFPRFIDSIRVDESIDRPSRQSLCPSPYSNLHPTSIKHSTQSAHSSHRY